MIAKKLFPVLIFSLSVFWLGSKLRAEDSPLTEMDPDIAKQYGGQIAEQFAKENKKLQVTIDADAEKAVGLFNPGSNEGIIMIPLKGFKEQNEGPKDAEKDTGVGLCYLFMSPTFNPLVDGKPVDQKKLRSVKFKDGDGNEKTATCLVCAVKHADGDEWQLYVYGTDKEPLVKSTFEEASDAPKADLALTVKDVQKDKATLVINFFGKYCTTIPIGHKK